ncbi:S1 RNA-binding domain-containing protein [Porphyromonas gulae]|uniref:CvfB family protein n=1 Tax=Porphyromonas gulae TaxID=111105 RepID=UPI0026F294CE|nr:S1-like domain-containing RNA-binding protein [Porphyromonas gulae]
MKRSKYRLGRIGRLTIDRIVSIGAYLDGGDTDILLPNRYLPSNAAPGVEVEVFVYHDNEGRLIATTMRPFVEVGQVALLRAVSVTDSGAYMEWGIHKDLFVPFREQMQLIHEGGRYFVYAYIDHVSGKIVGSAKLSKHLGNIPPSYSPGDEVSALVYERIDPGYRMIVDHTHWGMVYSDTLPMPLAIGAQVKAFVIRLREDGKIDLSLKPVGYGRIDSESERLIRILQKRGGRLPIGDKSMPEEILEHTGMSKKTFKMAVGTLYRRRLIRLTPTTIVLNDIASATEVGADGLPGPNN